jgi:hypothetical protein
MTNQDIRIGWMVAPKGSTCEYLDIDSEGENPCGDPAVKAQTMNMAGTDLDDMSCYCETHRLQVMKNIHRNDQAEAFEKQHGYPQGRNMLDLICSLGSRHMRVVKLAELKAPTAISEQAQELVDAAEHRIFAWLAGHSPKREGHKATLLKLWDSWSDKGTNAGDGYLDEMEVGFSRAVQLAQIVDDGGPPKP